jgi:lia operon protein LiaG
MENKIIKVNIAIWAVIAVILTALLVYFICNGHSYNIFNFRGYSNNFQVQKQQSVGINNCDKISLDFSSGDISFKTTDDSKLKVIERANSKLSDNEKFTVERDGNCISIKDDSIMSTSLNIFGFGYGAKEIEVDIPKNYNKDMDVATKSGDIRFNSDVTLNNLQCEQSSGDFNSENITANNISINSKSGDLRTKMLDTKGYNVQTSSGDIDINELSGSGQIEASSGDITINYEDIGDYSNVNDRSGDIKLSTPKSLSYEFNGKCSSGEINCNFDLNYKNKRGNEANGQVGTAPFKKITAETSSGDIRIDKNN